MAALYPTSISDQMYEVQPRKQTTLTQDEDNVTTTWHVGSTDGWPTKGFAACENETVYFSAITSTTITVQRGFAGTAVSHVSGVAVKLVVAAETTNRMIQEIIATQTFLGVSGSTFTTTIVGKLTNLWACSQALSTQVSNLNAQYLGGSTIGQINLAIAAAGANPSQVSGVSGLTIIQQNIEWTPNAFDLDNDNPATLITITGTSVVPKVKKVFFGNTDQADFDPFKMPASYNGGSITITYFYCGSTASVTHQLGIKIAKAASGGSYNPLFGSVVYLDPLTASGSTGIVKLYSTVLAGASLGLTTNTMNWIRVLGGTVNTVQLMNFGISWNKG